MNLFWGFWLLIGTIILSTSKLTRMAPTFEQLISQRSEKGFGEDLSFSDDFKISVRCVKCDEDLAFGQGRGLWTLKDIPRRTAIKLRLSGQSMNNAELFPCNCLVRILHLLNTGINIL